MQGDGFLVVGVDGDGAEGVLACFATITAVEKDPAEQNVSIDEFRIPEDGRLQRRDRSLLIAATKINATTEQIRFCIRGLDHYHPVQFRQRFVIATRLIQIARLHQ